MVGQRQLARVRRGLGNDFLDELHQVLDLLELAARILVEPAIAGEDVQLLQQLDRLAGAQFGKHGVFCTFSGAGACWMGARRFCF